VLVLAFAALPLLLGEFSSRRIPVTLAPSRLKRRTPDNRICMKDEILITFL